MSPLEQLLQDGGYYSSAERPVDPLTGFPIDPSMFIDPREYGGTRQEGERVGGGIGGDFLDWSKIPGMERFAEQLSASEQASSGGVYRYNDLMDELARRGYRIYVNDQNQQTTRGIVDASGNFVGSPQTFALSGNDAGFLRNAAIMAGGAAYGAYTGAGGGGAGIQTTDAAAALGGAETAGAGTTLAGSAGGVGAADSVYAGASAGSGAPAAPVGGSSWWEQALSSLGQGAGNMGMRDWINILSGLYGMNLSRNARDEMDPFRSQRPFYQQRLRELEGDPSRITQQPGWRAGLDAIGSEMASRGYFGGGNHAVGISRFAGDFYQREMQRLAGLAGAGATPGAGMGLSAGLAGQSLASIGYGLAPFSQNRPRAGGGGSYYGGGYTNLGGQDPEGVNVGP